MPNFTLTPRTWTIASGASLSDTLNIEGANVEGIFFPATITGSVLSFKVGYDSGSMVNLLDVNGIEVTIPIQAGKAVMLPYAMLRAWPFLAVRSGTSASPTSQGAAREIRMTTRLFS